MLIKTDKQNYINIADSIRHLNGKGDLYKPRQMLNELEKLQPSRGIVYDTFDGSGNLLTATLYGDRVGGLSYNDKMTTVNFADTVTEIRDCAFKGCSSLNFTELPESIKTIGSQAFSNCANLTLTKLPDSCEVIGKRAFEYCDGLTSFEFNDGLKSIGGMSFQGCSNLTITEIPDSVEYLYVECFNSCNTSSHIKLPKSLKYLGPYVFGFCQQLTSVTFQCIPTEHFDTSAFRARNYVWNSPIKHIYVPWAEGEVKGAPWGAKSATVHYNTAV